MKEQIIDFETAKLAKEKGFDWKCQTVYTDNMDVFKLEYFDGDAAGNTTNLTLEDNSDLDSSA